MYTEKEAWYVHGLLGLIIELILLMLIILNIVYEEMVFAYIFLILFLLILTSFTNNSMYEAKRVLFFGQYIGTLRKQGLAVTVPFTRREKVSLKPNSYEINFPYTQGGKECNVKIVLFYRVVDTAKATLPKKEVENFIKLYAEVIIYSLIIEQNVSINNMNEVNDTFMYQLNEKLKSFGIETIETYIYFT